VTVGASFSRIGGALCLDFTNTVTWHPDGEINERWLHPDAFIAWALHAGAVAASELRASARGRGRRTAVSPGRQQLRDAMCIRRSLHEVFSAMARNTRPMAHALAATDHFVRAAQRRCGLRFLPRANRYQWDVVANARPFETALARVASSALSLLRSDTHVVKLCANPHCGWLFLDESRRQNRRWCDMAECGARHKSRAHYARRRSRQ
jgi:predicted RNA-binding Zn ribbon-like protein